MADNDFANVPFDDEVRIWRPSEIPNTLFTPLLPSVSSLKMLVAPYHDDIGTKLGEETVSLQASMELDGDTLLFVKIVLMFAEVAAVHLDVSKSYVKQDINTMVAYVTEVEKRFPKVGDYFVDAWPAYAFANIYLEQLKAREERRQELDRQTERVRSIVHSVCELLSVDRTQSVDVGQLNY